MTPQTLSIHSLKTMGMKFLKVLLNSSDFIGENDGSLLHETVGRSIGVTNGWLKKYQMI